MEALRDAHPHQPVLLQVVLGYSASVPPAQGINIKLTGSSCKEWQRLPTERMVCETGFIGLLSTIHPHDSLITVSPSIIFFFCVY